jgi:hypothetical protein
MVVTNPQKRWRRTLALLTLALLVGVGAAFAVAGLSSASPAWAGPHCTRYAPPTAPDTLCATWTGNIYGLYCTNSTALRDENFVLLATSTRWELDYTTGANCSGTHYMYAASNSGTYGHIGASNGYAGANCSVPLQAVNGDCTTNWHT